MMKEQFFVERRSQLQPKNEHLLQELRNVLGLQQLQKVRIVNIYECEHFPQNLREIALQRVFGDAVVDIFHQSLPRADFVLIIAPLQGQFDQRADSAQQCLLLIDESFAKTRVATAEAHLFYGDLSAAERQKLTQYLVNPIDSCVVAAAQNLQIKSPTTLAAPVAPCIHHDLLNANDIELAQWLLRHNLAMSVADLQVVQRYFQEQRRAPSDAEIRLLDTYWSDHCRHTTFNCELENFTFPDCAFGALLQADFAAYQADRKAVYGDAAAQIPHTLMDLATIDAKYQKLRGNIDDVEFSAEVNACSVFVDVDDNGEQQRWLLQFKNETHNHPTEIEPFGGAATCIGGAIRDPLAGRAYVYQALRLSGCGDPREALAATISGKLPQRFIAQTAAAGASSYGNQIGLATGQVVEFYHRGYKAKHMEVGAVVGATPACNVNRITPQNGDAVLLIGGATGRDGCGGATGSSRQQHDNSLTASAAEVQKGNPLEERKLQRLFSKREFARRIKRCNDFGAGGVAVAVGELAAGVAVDLDSILVKYQGLSATELMLSESQERMAVVVADDDVATIIDLAAKENLHATKIASVNDSQMLTMKWQNKTIVALSRQLLDSNGAACKQKNVAFSVPNGADYPHFSCQSPPDYSARWISELQTQLAQLKFGDQRALGDRFDHSVGAGAVLLPYGGRYQNTPIEASVYSLPTTTTTASILAYGFDPDLCAYSPYHGGLCAVVEATARVVASGGSVAKTHYSLQEYFKKLDSAPENWGLPYAALLGAHKALRSINRAAIGGKDSMSGSFNDLHVPPTLIAFAVTTIAVDAVISAEFKEENNILYWLRCRRDEHLCPDLEAFAANNDYLQTISANAAHNICSIRSVRHGGVLQAIYECSLGNLIGANLSTAKSFTSALFTPEYGSYLISSKCELQAHANLQRIGTTCSEATISIGEDSVAIAKLHAIARAVLAPVYQLHAAPSEISANNIDINYNNCNNNNDNCNNNNDKNNKCHSAHRAAPRVVIAVFPGSNSELDTARSFNAAGAIVTEAIICNRNFADINNSITALITKLQQAQIFALPGGFSAGDEPDGSGKFIAALLANPRVSAAIDEFLQRDGLIIGICNGFQALLKSGLLTRDSAQNNAYGAPTLSSNTIGRHIARVATTIIVNNHSPWLRDFAIGAAHEVCLSHGEGRFMASDENLQQLIDNRQIATQYADPDSARASMAALHNPNGSMYAVEGITSRCGKIFGKMGHSERHRRGLQRNYPNFRDQDIFSAGVRAFY